MAEKNHNCECSHDTKSGSTLIGNFGSPTDSMSGEREKILYVACIQNPSKDCNPQKPDYLATVDVDPDSSNYCKVGTKHRSNMF